MIKRIEPGTEIPYGLSKNNKNFFIRFPLFFLRNKKHYDIAEDAYYIGNVIVDYVLRFKLFRWYTPIGKQALTRVGLLYKEKD
jgi:hypothetical protein